MAGPFASLAQMVQNFESAGSGGYNAVNGNHYGAYQFSPSTWLQYAPAAGVDTKQYPDARGAPASVQDAVFNQAVAQNGLGDWTCAGCNPKLSSYLQSNPGAYNLPVQAGGTGGTAAPGGVPGPGAAAATPTGTGAPTASVSFYIIAVILVVFLLAAGLWGLIKG